MNDVSMEISADPTAFAEKGFVILQVLNVQSLLEEFLIPGEDGDLKHLETY